MQRNSSPSAVSMVSACPDGDEAPVIVPAAVHCLRKQGNPVLAIAGEQKIVVDLERSLRSRRGLGEGRDQRPFPASPVLSGFRRTALEGLIRDVRGERNGDRIEARDCRDLVSRDGKCQPRRAHYATLHVPAAFLTNTLTIFVPSPEEAASRSAPLTVTLMAVFAL